MERTNEQLIAELCAGTYRPTELPSEIVAKGWCQGHVAEDEKGNPVDPQSRRAVRRCMRAAGMKAWRTDLVGSAENQGFQEWEFIVHSVMPNGWHSSYQDWEDAPERTKEEVLAVLRKTETIMGLP